MIRVRAEENAVMLWNRESARTAYISGEELNSLCRWALDGSRGGFIQRLLSMRVIEDKIRPNILAAIEASQSRKAPPHSFCAPESLHIELTSNCHLECPQCYKGCSNPSDLTYDILSDVISQSDKMNVFQIALGGGEPLLYHRLTDAVSNISRHGMSCSITTGGVGLNGQLLDELIISGIDHIQVSINGSREEINALSRDGFKAAVEALCLLKDSAVSYGVNWVARMDNIDDLQDFIKFVKARGAQNINILRYKPGPNEEYERVSLTKDKALLLAQMINDIKGISVKVDSAFSNLLCGRNKRTGHFGGCGAGRRFLAMDAEGYFRPCSHVNMRERAASLADYWETSNHLKMFRETEENLLAPCSNCGYLSGCRGCRAAAFYESDNFYSGDRNCCFYTG